MELMDLIFSTIYLVLLVYVIIYGITFGVRNIIVKSVALVRRLNLTRQSNLGELCDTIFICSIPALLFFEQVKVFLLNLYGIN